MGYAAQGLNLELTFQEAREFNQSVDWMWFGKCFLNYGDLSCKLDPRDGWLDLGTMDSRVSIQIEYTLINIRRNFWLALEFLYRERTAYLWENIKMEV